MGTPDPDQQQPIANIAKAVDGHEQWLTDHSRAFEQLNAWVARLETELSTRPHPAQLDALAERIENLERANSVRVFMEWINHARLTTGPRVSVIMPTRNRAAFLPAAIASVQAQTYPTWELVVVDDASDDSTPALLSTVDDPRVRSVRVAHGGCCAARNAGLDAASGEIIAYLDDDNLMHPAWLKSVVWAFEQRPDIDVLYGAFVLDDMSRVNQQGAGSLPTMFLRSYDRQTLLTENLADISAVAHRAGLPGARFDESLIEMGDWDLLCALTAERDPLVLPAIACFYTTDAPNRLSGGPTYQADYDTVRYKHTSEGTVP
jgi:Glycosyl transferase family 2